MDFLIVGCAGFFGAISRYSIYLLEKRFNPSFPLATFIINIFGCVIAGILLGLAIKASPQNKQLLTLLSIGFVGSFTTFSTFSVENLHLFKANQFLMAGTNIVLSVLLGVVAVWIGSKIVE